MRSRSEILKAAFSGSSEKLIGGRVLLLFLLFALALYLLFTSGIALYAVICVVPVLFLALYLALEHRMLTFWALFTINYLLQWKNFPIPGIPMSLPNEMLELFLLAIAVIDFKELKIERAVNPMLMALLIWGAFCTVEVLNDTCGLGFQVGAWYAGARMLSFQLTYAFLVYVLFITSPKLLVRYLFVWGCFAIFAAFWCWRQHTFGFNAAENRFLARGGAVTHIINGGTLTRYFSIFSDAANYGCNMAATAVAFIVFGITSKIRRHKIFFLVTGLLCIKEMFPSGTRTAIVCLFAGFALFLILSKSFKIAIPAALFGGIALFLLAFTNVANGNSQIRRMRTAFNKEDASANVRTLNQAAMKKYLDEAPWGMGIGINYSDVPANNKFNTLANLPPDSEYVYIWIHTGYIGITVFLITTAIMFFFACKIVFFDIKSRSLQGIGAGMCCAFAAIQLGGYGNQVLMQFPNCLVFYGGLSLVYVLPYIESEWDEYESKILAQQEEKKRLKLEKKRAERV